MSHLNPDLTRRLDRLAFRAHLFHRYAHHPLCEAYRSEVWALGPRCRICKGCSLALLGLLLALPPALWLPGFPLTWLAGMSLLALSMLFLARSLSFPKLLSRFVPFFLGNWAVVAGFRSTGHLAFLVSVSTLLGFGLAWILYRRIGPRRAPCEHCSEANQTVCSGFQAIFRREKALARLASRWISSEPKPMRQA